MNGDKMTVATPTNHDVRVKPLPSFPGFVEQYTPTMRLRAEVNVAIPPTTKHVSVYERGVIRR